jgi:alkylhydroperoxidase family enzyme
MMKWFLGRSIGQFERRFEYDATYLRHLLEVSPEAFLRFSGVKLLGGYVRDVPPAVFHAASIRSALRADCGPCVQLVVRFAELDGVDPSTLRAIVKGELDALDEPVRLGALFAGAVLDRAPAMDELRERLRDLYGERALISLTFGILGSQLYPTLKYALGYGRTCAAVRIGGESIVPSEPLALGQEEHGYAV